MSAWIERVPCKAVHVDPRQRYTSLSEFVHDLRHPGTTHLGRTRRPLLERHSVLYWKA